MDEDRVEQHEWSPTDHGRHVVSRKHVLKAGAAALAGVSALPVLDSAGTALAGSPGRAARATNVTISMWTHDILYVKFFTARAKEWEKQYPQYHFTYNFVQIPYNDLFTKVLANLSAGTGAPDLVGIEINAFSRFMKGDIATKGLVDLSPLIGSQRNQFLRWDPYMYRGRIYGVESALCPVGLYYREDIFKDAGIKAPLASYNDLLAAGRILAKKGKYIMMVESQAADVWLEMFQQAGGHIFDAGGKLTLDDPRAVQILEFLVKGAKDKLFWAPPNLYTAPAIAALKLNKVAAVLMPDWYAGYFLKPQVVEQKGKWRLQTMPVWSTGGRRVSTLGGTGFAITRQSRHQQLVWSLLHYTYMTEKNQVKRFQQIDYFPTMKEALHDPGVTNVPDPYFGGEKIGGVFASVAADIPQQYQSPYWNEAITQLTNEYTNAMAGRKTPARAIKDATTAIQKIMVRGS
jgi:multiple sugar transport system substrate-binding protein/arabinosaccharide transport system substrate-binding protein